MILYQFKIMPEVAKLAGLPQKVIRAAYEIMAKLEFEDEIADRIVQPLKDEKEVVDTPDVSLNVLKKKDVRDDKQTTLF